MEKTASAEHYIRKIKRKLSLSVLQSYFKKLEKLKILIIGDTILDEYVFVEPKGRAMKDPILSAEYHYHELYAGGILAIANHVSSYVDQINLVTLIGDKNSNLKFIKSSLGKNINLKTFVKENSPTTLKKRYIDGYRNNKLFKVEYMNDLPIDEDLTKNIISYLQNELPKYDMVIVGDFGHGFLNSEIRMILQLKSKFLSLNAQSNSANRGFNYINHYKRADFAVMSDEEIRLPIMMRYEKIDEVLNKFYQVFRYKKFLVTIGRQGCVFFNRGKLYKSPVFTNHVVDTVGAGDAVLAISSLFAHLNADDEIIPFIANCTGGVKTSIMGNKESVTKEKLLDFIENLYKNELEHV